MRILLAAALVVRMIITETNRCLDIISLLVSVRCLSGLCGHVLRISSWSDGVGFVFHLSGWDGVC